MPNAEDLLAMMTPEVYQNLKSAVELGKWPDGTALTPEQVESCMQGVILYESQNMSADERSGYMPPKNVCKSTSPVKSKSERII